MKSDQRLRILNLYAILMRYTDEEHMMSMDEIIKRLSEAGISAARKALYADIRALQEFGLDVIMAHDGRHTGYKVVSRDIDLTELRSLADLVCGAGTISVSKTRQLVEELSKLCSVYEAEELNESLSDMDSDKTGNERVYLNIDKLRRAISFGQKVRLRDKSGSTELVSPCKLVLKNGWYELIYVSDAAPEELGTVRVDEILKIEETELPAVIVPEDIINEGVY